MGENSYCNYKCFFDLSDDIIIGKNVAVGMNVSFINSTHTNWGILHAGQRRQLDTLLL